MQREKTSSIKEFWQKYKGLVNTKTCIVSDIDNVWFDGFFNLNAWVSRFEEWKLDLMKEISEKTNFLLFTNRGFWGSWKGAYKDQLRDFFGADKMSFYKNSQSFLVAKEYPKFALVQNAKKPSDYSVEVMKTLLEHYDKIYYISSKDFPFIYSDLDLMNLIEKTLDPKLLQKLVFIDIIR